MYSGGHALMRLRLPETRWTRTVNAVHDYRYRIFGLVLLVSGLIYRVWYDVQQQQRLLRVEASMKGCDCDAP